MSKSSKSKATKSKATKANQKKTQHAPKKIRGTWLTVALVVIVLHGLLAAVFYATARLNTTYLDRPWALSLMALHFLANVVAAIGIWNWQKWGLYVYAGSAVLALVVGLVTVGIWSVFYMVLPLAILGWLLRTKWSYF
jgi:lipoprotein signal peptidase